MLVEKTVLSVEELEAQTAFELPERELMALINVVLLNGNTVQVPIASAVNICGVQLNVLTQFIASHQGQQVFCKAGAGAAGLSSK